MDVEKVTDMLAMRVMGFEEVNDAIADSYGPGWYYDRELGCNVAWRPMEDMNACEKLARALVNLGCTVRIEWVGNSKVEATVEQVISRSIGCVVDQCAARALVLAAAAWYLDTGMQEAEHGS